MQHFLCAKVRKRSSTTLGDDTKGDRSKYTRYRHNWIRGTKMRQQIYKCYHLPLTSHDGISRAISVIFLRDRSWFIRECLSSIIHDQCQRILPWTFSTKYYEHPFPHLTSLRTKVNRGFLTALHIYKETDSRVPFKKII